MRKIKFRVFKNEMIYELGLLNTSSLIDLQKEGYILMEYTGINDKNELEIFEGDIVKRTVIGYCETIEEIGFIDFQNGSFVFNSTAKDRFKTSLYEDLKPYPSKAMPEYEVVGNVYENAELLKN